VVGLKKADKVDIKAFIFDLDGVIVDTAKYHYLAWKRLAEELGFFFSEADNERLKGVSRMQSLDILLEVGGLDFNETKRLELAAKKNNWYVEYIMKMTPDEILPGVIHFLEATKQKGLKTALGSASKNAPLILERVNLLAYFDLIIDGNEVGKAKPDPEVFLKAAERLGLNPAECLVFEDAEAGIEAALNANMKVVGVGDKEILKKANMVIDGFSDTEPELFMALGKL
jgi:beta-phosphoglucomutase